MAILSDQEIGALIQEAKTMPEGLSPAKLKLTERNRHKRKDFKIESKSGSAFTIAIRQSTINMMDFSVILGYQLPNIYRVFRLRRYNGKHRHTNCIEKETLDGFHIHTATERYQAAGFTEDHFAEATDRYYSLESAICCLVSDCGFEPPLESMPLFNQGGLE
jgi:hypothetical protein